MNYTDLSFMRLKDETAWELIGLLNLVHRLRRTLKKFSGGEEKNTLRFRIHPKKISGIGCSPPSTGWGLRGEGLGLNFQATLNIQI